MLYYNLFLHFFLALFFYLFLFFFFLWIIILIFIFIFNLIFILFFLLSFELEFCFSFSINISFFNCSNSVLLFSNCFILLLICCFKDSINDIFSLILLLTVFFNDSINFSVSNNGESFNICFCLNDFISFIIILNFSLIFNSFLFI